MITKDGLMELCRMMDMREGDIIRLVEETYTPKLVEEDDMARCVRDYLKEHGPSTISHPSKIRKAARLLGVTTLEFVDAVILLDDCGVLDATFIKDDCDNVISKKTN